MHGASAQGFNTIIKYLADHGADPNIKDARGQTPLDLALRRNGSLQSSVDLLRSLAGKTSTAK